jgi:hypothetical protein
MDTLSHALWGKGLFGYRGKTWLALFFGEMPDLFSFGFLFFLDFYQKVFQIFLLEMGHLR